MSCVSKWFADSKILRRLTMYPVNAAHGIELE